MKKLGNILFLILLVSIMVIMTLKDPMRYPAIYISAVLGTLIWIYLTFFRKRPDRRLR